MMLYSIIKTEKCENKYDLNHLIFFDKKSIDLNRDLNKWFKSANPAHSITYYPPIKCPIVKWFCGLHTRISFQLAKLLAVDVILYHTVFQRSFRELSL